MILLETHIHIVHTTYTQSEEHFSRTTKTHFTATRSEISESNNFINTLLVFRFSISFYICFVLQRKVGKYLLPHKSDFFF